MKIVFIRILIKLIPERPSDNKSLLVRVMALGRGGK